MSAPDYHPGPAFDVLGKLRAAEAEVSRLRAVVARVEALADSAGDLDNGILVWDLRAALRGDA